MSDKFDNDIAWLFDKAEKIGKIPSEAQEYAFSDAVNTAMMNGSINENSARVVAFSEMFGGR